MITGWILYAFNGLITVLLSPFTVLNDVSLDPGLAHAIGNVQSLYSSLDPIFPVGVLLTILGIVVSVELAILTYKFTMWLIRKVPGIS